MINSRILTIVGATALIGGQSGLATAAARHHYEATPASAFLATSRGGDDNPLADRAATLGGQAFTIERAEGIDYKATKAGSATVTGNPLKDRAETLGGRAFTAERAEGVAYRAPDSASVAASDEVIGNPLKDRAETLGGKAFTVERESGAAVSPGAHFLAEYR